MISSLSNFEMDWKCLKQVVVEHLKLPLHKPFTRAMIEDCDSVMLDIAKIVFFFNVRKHININDILTNYLKKKKRYFKKQTGGYCL